MKVLSLFSGIGAFEKALDNLGVPYELAGYCEIDKHASKSYAAIHGVSEDLNLGDITKVDERAIPKDLDLTTYGFPCQDISTSGKLKGLIDTDGKQTRSGLLFDALRIIEDAKPRVAIAENVKNLTSRRFKQQFELVLKSLEDAGYNNYWKVLNLKEFGIPQNRERVFIVSIRKDVDNGLFSFPTGFPLKLHLKDVLEEMVDMRYYLSDRGLERLARRMKAGDAPEAKNLSGNGQPCMTVPAVLRPERTEYGKAIRKAYEAGEIHESRHNMTTLRPRTDGISNTLTTVLKDNYVMESAKRIRELTPKEYFRLMGFSDEDHEKAASVNSNTQLYKQAGNSIGVPCVEYILLALFDCGALAR